MSARVIVNRNNDVKMIATARHRAGLRAKTMTAHSVAGIRSGPARLSRSACWSISNIRRPPAGT
jgi:hypothetical protein